MIKLKRLFVVVFLLGVCNVLLAQITVNQNDFANAGETVFINRANVPLGLNFSATGANFTWNFSQLRNNGQEQVDYRTVASTGVVYSLYYLDIFLNPNRANMALEGSDIPFNQLLGVANPYTFYFKNNNEFRKVGYGGELLGAPVPINLNNNDVIYRFPMNFGNSHTSFSDYDISVPGLPAVSYSQRRETVVDGWGTLTTPYGTFSVLRTKSEIFGRDSVSLGIAIPRAKVTEYKWIAKNEDVPILQINTTTLLGIETIDDIFFKDRKMGVVVNSINGSVCPGAQVTVNYTKSGTYNPSAFLQAGNQFRVQLSNGSGSFANPVQIGSVNSTASGTINATIPANTQPGSNYYLRIVTTSPQVVGDTFGPFVVNPNPVATITAVGPTTVCANQTVTLNGNTGPFQYQWNRGGTPIPNATSNTFNANVTGAYTLSTSNVCGTATSSAINVTVRPEPVHTLHPSSLSTCDGSPISINSVFNAGVGPFTYRWFYNSDTIVGATAPNLTAPFTGQYELLVRDNIGCPFKTPPLALRVDSVDIPQVSVITNSLMVGKWVFICPDDTVRLQTSNVPGFNYRWQRNGVDIPGAVNPVLNVTGSGNYSVVVADTCDSEVSDTIKVATVARPVHEILASATAICQGVTVNLTADNISNSTPNVYRWFESGNLLSGQNADSISVNTPGSYAVEIVDEFGCVYRSPEKVIAAGNATPPAIFASGDTVLCEGENVTLTSDTNSVLSYQWNLAGVPIQNATSNSLTTDVAGIYSLTTSTVCGALSSAPITLTVNPLPNYTINAPITTTCDGLPVTLTAVNVSGSSAVFFSWYRNGNAISGQASDVFIADSSGNYSVKVTDAFGCSYESAETSVSIVNGSAPQVYNSGNNAFCASETITLSTDTNSMYSYQWQLNNAPIAGATQASYQPVASGDYTVLVSIGGACILKSAEVGINIYASPAQPQLNFSGDTIIASSAAAYQWFFEGNPILGANSALLKPDESGTYTLVITDANGCTASTTIFFFKGTVGIDEAAATWQFKVYPNPFSDRFFIGSEAELQSVRLYEPSGRLLHEHHNSLLFKEHSIDASELPAGIYMLTITSGKGIAQTVKLMKY